MICVSVYFVLCHYKVLIGRLHIFNLYALQWIFDHCKILIIDGMRFNFLSFADVYGPMCPTNIEQSTDNGSNGANVSFSMQFTDNVDPFFKDSILSSNLSSTIPFPTSQ